ncbi:MAG: recombinase family protein [Clostridia bacterium]|nr:recombinase family protein [Clostridia bacterium]
MITKQQIYNAAIYCRLSAEDNLAGESGSISTQRTLLTQYCKSQGFTITDYYVDDGFSGTNFDRPDFERLLNDIDKGKINVVLTKDLSRFGRDYIQAGYFIEKVFERKNVRYIAVDDNIDTLNNNNDILMPIKNVLNDMYARDVSRKTRAAFNAKARNGEYIVSRPPFGYKKDPNNKHKLIVDEEAARTVQYIFKLCSEGNGYNRITKILRKDGYLNPIAYFNRNNPDYYKADYWRKPFDWHITSIRCILSNMVYLGHTIYGKQRVKIMSTSKKIKAPEEDWVITYNTHEPLVSQETWDLVQSMLKSRKRETRTGEIQIFSGLLSCSDCGSALTYAGKQKGTTRKGEYSCWFYKTHGKEYCSSHYITYDNLYKIVIEDIRMNARLAERYEDRYLRQLMDADTAKQKKQVEKDKKEIEATKLRIADLDTIIKKLYEDNVLGKITDKRFASLSGDYEKEQQELSEKLEALTEKVWTARDNADKAQHFLGFIRKYTELDELNAKILNELIDKIVVHHKTVNEVGERVQKIEIFYKFVGLLQAG